MITERQSQQQPDFLPGSGLFDNSELRVTILPAPFPLSADSVIGTPPRSVARICFPSAVFYAGP